MLTISNNEEVNNSIFFDVSYLKKQSDKFGVLNIFEDEKLICVFSFVERNSFIFKYAEIQKMKFYCTNLNKRLIYSAIEEYFCSYNYDFIITANQSFTDSYPDNAKFCEFGTLRADLSLDKEEVWNNINGKHKNVIRKFCNENDFKIVISDRFFECYQLIMNVLADEGITMMDYLKFEDICNSKFAKLFSISIDGKIICSALFYFDTEMCYYMYSGRQKNSPNGAMNLLIWEVMIYFREMGVKTIDFVGARVNAEVGSKYESIQRFKQRFGATFYRGYLWKIIINEKKYWLFNICLIVYNKCKKKSYLGDIIDQENRRSCYKENVK